MTASLPTSITQGPSSANSAGTKTWPDTHGQIRAVEFSADVKHYIERYTSVGHRGDFLWRWAHVGIGQTTLSCVLPELYEGVRDTKLLAVILNVLLDDLADRDASAEVLEVALELVESPRPRAGLIETLSSKSHEYVKLIAELWHEVSARTRGLPSYEFYAELFEFDYRQVFNCMRYGLLLRTLPSLNNKAEHGLYQPHNMNMMVFATLDLMASPEVEEDELGLLREAFWCAQGMGQISNMLVTWEREIPDRDFSSGVFAIARSRSLLSVDDLRELSPEGIANRIRAGRLEDDLLLEWNKRRRRLCELALQIESAEIPELISGLESLLSMTLASRGLL